MPHFRQRLSKIISSRKEAIDKKPTPQVIQPSLLFTIYL